jgi:hypothetical protein
MLATYGDRSPEDVPEDIDSMELAWLIHQVEQRAGRQLNFEDGMLGQMSTVSGAVQVLRDLGLEAIRE